MSEPANARRQPDLYWKQLVRLKAEWESIYPGNIPDEGITERRARLAKLQLEAEHKHFPEGFEPGRRLVDLAIDEANQYLSQTYSEASNRA